MVDVIVMVSFTVMFPVGVLLHDAALLHSVIDVPPVTNSRASSSMGWAPNFWSSSGDVTTSHQARRTNQST